MNCEWCGKSFEPKMPNQKFCREKCRNSASQKRFHAQHKSNCAKCGKEIRLGSTLCASCSRQSARKIFGNTTVGEIKEWVSYRHWFANEIRRDARERVHVKRCLVCGYDKHTEVCHIRQITDFPDTATIDEVNALSNLTVLCPNCHWELDKGLIQPIPLG